MIVRRVPPLPKFRFCHRSAMDLGKGLRHLFFICPSMTCKSVLIKAWKLWLVGSCCLVTNLGLYFIKFSKVPFPSKSRFWSLSPISGRIYSYSVSIIWQNFTNCADLHFKNKKDKIPNVQRWRGLFVLMVKAADWLIVQTGGMEKLLRRGR